MKKHTILIIGCGDIGTELGRRLHENGHVVYGVRRQPQKLPPFLRGVRADFIDAGQLQRQLLPLQPDYVVITLTPSGFSAAEYQQCFVTGSHNILAALATVRQRLFFVSSTSVYHQSNGEWVDEESPTEPDRFNGKAVLDAERLMLASEWPVTVVRFAGVYGPGRLRMISKLRRGAPVTASTNFSNRIHRDDCAGLLHHLMTLDAASKPVKEYYLGVDHEPAPLQEVQLWLAHKLQLLPSESNENPSPGSSNKRCSNKRILASGFKFEYASYRAGYEALLRAEGLLPPTAPAQPAVTKP